MGFYFSIVDDTDYATLENVRPIYDLLQRLGIRITKTIWPLVCLEADNPHVNADTLENKAYRHWIQHLQADGVEIAYHGASAGSNLRAYNQQGLQRFAEVLGDYPRMHVNHHKNKDNIYWGAARFNHPLLRGIVGLNQWRRGLRFEGQHPDSPYYWADICQQHIRYSRNFSFIKQINLNTINPTQAYQDLKRPEIAAWFSSCDGGTVTRFLELLSTQNIDQLVDEHGVCIVYTHFGHGFVKDGQVLPNVMNCLTYLSQQAHAEFMPVSDWLDQRQVQILPNIERRHMEKVWLTSKLLNGGTS